MQRVVYCQIPYNYWQVDSGNSCTVLKFFEVEEAQLSTVEQRLTLAQPETTTNLLQQSLQEDLAGLDLTVSVTEVQVLHTSDQIDREQNKIEADATGHHFDHANTPSHGHFRHELAR